MFLGEARSLLRYFKFTSGLSFLESDRPKHEENEVDLLVDIDGFVASSILR